jgi:hypothetical protein
MIQFSEWLPDQPPIASGTITATNVIPAAQGYRSMSQFVEYSNAADSTIKGIFAAKDDASNANLFAGDAGKLYKHNSATNNLDDISKVGTPAYDLTADERWRFVEFGQYVIAAGGVGEELQSFQLGTSSAFSNLGGSPPKADFIATVRDFIWVANLDSGTGRIPYRCQWSGFNAIDSWTAGTDQSDFQDLVDAGAITGLVGGEYCTILTERAIFRATYSGLPLVWQFDKVESQKGCAFKHSVCNISSLVFYLSDDGFYAFDGQKSTPIGSEKVNDFFFNDFDSNYDTRMSASVDPNREIAMWSYTSTQSPTGQPDKIIVYNYVLNKWSLLAIEADYLSPFFASGYTSDGLASIDSLVDNINTAVDSRLYKGGQYVFGGAYGDKIYSFTGSPLTGTIETAEVPLTVGKHSIVTRVYPYYEGGSVSLQVGTRNNQTDDASFTASVSPNTDGFSPFRAQGRYHRAKFVISGSWSNALGIDIEATAVGGR